MERRDKINYYLDLADVVARRGTCLRRLYGAVIVKKRRGDLYRVCGRSQREEKLLGPGSVRTPEDEHPQRGAV